MAYEGWVVNMSCVATTSKLTAGDVPRSPPLAACSTIASWSNAAT